MSEHKNGRMTITEHSWSDTGLYVDGNKIALISIESEATEENQEQLEQVASANARRLAAAWNAFDGVSPPLVDCIADNGGVLLMLSEASRQERELNSCRNLLREVVASYESQIMLPIDRYEAEEKDRASRITSYLKEFDGTK